MTRYLKHPKIAIPIIYDERYEKQGGGWVPFSKIWHMTSSGGRQPDGHTLDLLAYKCVKFVTPHTRRDSPAREDNYYQIPFNEFVLTKKAY